PPLDVSVTLFFFQAEDGIRDYKVTGVQTCALPIFSTPLRSGWSSPATTSPIEGAWRQVVLSVSVCPRGTPTSCSPSSSITPPLSASATTSVESICPGNRGFQYVLTTGADACFCMTAMTSRVATNRALGNFF